MIQYLVSVGTLGVITAILVLGVNVRWGFAGELDLGFYLFPAVGAYIYGVVTLPKASKAASISYILGWNQSFPVGVLAAAVVGAVLALVLGAISLRRLRANYFAIVTVASAIIGYAFISQYKPLFNGYNGLYAIAQPFSGSVNLDAQQYADFFFGICLAFLLVIYAILEMIRRSPFGRAVKAVREDEVAALAFGRSPYVLRLKAYVIGGVVGAIGGALLVNYVQAFSPTAWSPLETFLLYGALLVGGTGNNLGAVLGAMVVLIAFPQLVLLLPGLASSPDALPAIENMVVGALIILTLYFKPGGLIPELKSMSGQFRTRGQWNVFWRRKARVSPTADASARQATS
ncbi:branched-chain amino acid ABC transporter permease [Jatrophihabitans telluris]|uniref:Branched-chain amino acid ABC transporter permease n=1 Tax=Jatrophihabitans telluris TaxID=2038343 RepID=A0ABY4R043_9ACTN|nr:branched-chain amino acid ABC transporter permease [Jatrophihabitans telluris]UQX88963.1 branched-chain amino acid ABC transporter permease [Jatrophihabitans telluris]